MYLLRTRQPVWLALLAWLWLGLTAQQQALPATAPLDLSLNEASLQLRIETIETGTAPTGAIHSSWRTQQSKRHYRPSNKKLPPKSSAKQRSWPPICSKKILASRCAKKATAHQPHQQPQYQLPGHYPAPRQHNLGRLRQLAQLRMTRG